MDSKEKKPPNPLIITKGNTSIVQSGGKHVTSRMVGEALAVAREHGFQKAHKKYKIGDFELNEPDYRMVLGWALELDLDPEEVLQQLADLRYETWGDETLELVIQDGSIKQLVWGGEYLPIKTFHWEPGLELHSMAVRGAMPTWSNPVKLVSLKKLYLDSLALTELDLTLFPNLSEISCDDNQLTELDLTPVPHLTRLRCGTNQLTELDLTPVPHLTRLRCGTNQLTELDLTPVPYLELLWCGTNQLTELDLTPVPDLKFLLCDDNQLTELDLTSVPHLTRLSFATNQLTELDLTPVPHLTHLRCGTNQLTVLDLRPLKELPANAIKHDPHVRIIR